jgi:hypothetical protein
LEMTVVPCCVGSTVVRSSSRGSRSITRPLSSSSSRQSRISWSSSAPPALFLLLRDSPLLGAFCLFGSTLPLSSCIQRLCSERV